MIIESVVIMNEKMSKIFDQIANLNNREAVEFLISNNLHIDEETFKYLKQVVLSQVHFDEHMMILMDFFLGTQISENSLYIGKDGKIEKLDAQKALDETQKEFFSMLKDIKKLNFDKFDEVMKFLLEYYDPDFQYTKEDFEFIKQYGQDFISGKEKLTQEVEDFASKFEYQDQIRYNLGEYENKKKDLEQQLDYIKSDVLRSTHALRKAGLRGRIFDKDNYKTLKMQKVGYDTSYAQAQKLLDNFEKKHQSEQTEFKPVEMMKDELIDVLNKCYHLSLNKLNRKKIEEFKYILNSGINLEENFKSVQGRLRDAVLSLTFENGLYFCPELFADIASQLKLITGLYSEQNLQSSDLLILTENIRNLMARSRIYSQITISPEYRQHKLEYSKYIKGYKYTKEEITAKMNELNEEYKTIEKEENIENYIRGCADIFQKFLMIHPYTDGNGRTSRSMLMILLAKRGIFIPNIYSSYIERDSNSMFMVFGNEASINGNFTLFEDYLLARVQEFYPDLIKQDFSYLKEVHQNLLKGENKEENKNTMHL